MKMTTRAIETIGSPHGEAIALFLWIARHQPLHSANTRTGLLMTNGVLLSRGYDIVTIGTERSAELGTRLIQFHDSGDGTQILKLMAQCSNDPNLVWTDA